MRWSLLAPPCNLCHLPHDIRARLARPNDQHVFTLKGCCVHICRRVVRFAAKRFESGQIRDMRLAVSAGTTNKQVAFEFARRNFDSRRSWQTLVAELLARLEGKAPLGAAVGQSFNLCDAMAKSDVTQQPESLGEFLQIRDVFARSPKPESGRALM